MKILFVIDSITDLNSKINMIKTRFGNDILYVVKYNLTTLVKTYGISPNATYQNNFIKVVHTLLAYNLEHDIIVCYSSVNLNNELLNNFITKIGNKEKIVNVMPHYNSFEKLNNNIYNIYVNSLFKAKDTMASPKLQFIPAELIPELLSTHFGNRLFNVDEKYTSTLYIEKGDLNKSLKTKISFSKWYLIPIIVALIISLALTLSLAFIKLNYLLILIFTLLYVLDIIIAVIFHCKSKFDKRFLQ